MTPDSIDLTWRNWRFQRRERSFREPMVRSIRIADSTWNGELIGLGAGVTAAVLIAGQCDRESCVVTSSTLAVLAPAAGWALGLAIDAATTRTVYEARGRRVTVSPVVGPNFVRVSGKVGF